MVTKLGPFDYEPLPQDSVKRILKDVQNIDGGGKYYGFWYGLDLMTVGMR